MNFFSSSEQQRFLEFFLLIRAPSRWSFNRHLRSYFWLLGRSRSQICLLMQCTPGFTHIWAFNIALHASGIRLRHIRIGDPFKLPKTFSNSGSYLENNHAFWIVTNSTKQKQENSKPLLLYQIDLIEWKRRQQVNKTVEARNIAFERICITCKSGSSAIGF